MLVVFVYKCANLRFLYEFEWKACRVVRRILEMRCIVILIAPVLLLLWYLVYFGLPPSNLCPLFKHFFLWIKKIIGEEIAGHFEENFCRNHLQFSYLNFYFIVSMLKRSREIFHERINSHENIYITAITTTAIKRRPEKYGIWKHSHTAYFPSFFFTTYFFLALTFPLPAWSNLIFIVKFKEMLFCCYSNSQEF